MTNLEWVQNNQWWLEQEHSDTECKPKFGDLVEAWNDNMFDTRYASLFLEITSDTEHPYRVMYIKNGSLLISNCQHVQIIDARMRNLFSLIHAKLTENKII